MDRFVTFQPGANIVPFLKTVLPLGGWTACEKSPSFNMPDPPGCAGQSSAGYAAMAIWLSLLDDVSGVLLLVIPGSEQPANARTAMKARTRAMVWSPPIKARTYGAWLPTDPRPPSR